MHAPMLSRTRRRGHVHCDCHEWRSTRTQRAWRRAHTRQARATENRTWRNGLREEITR